jgi:hypothetical protein
MTKRAMLSVVIVIAGLAGTAWAQPKPDEVRPTPPAGGIGQGSSVGRAGKGAGVEGSAAAPVGYDVPVAPPDGIGLPADLKGQCVALARGDTAWWKDQCMTAIRADKAWNEELFEQVKTWNATQLLAQSQAAHEADGQQIAKNKKHVVIAYAAMWLCAAGFLIFLWRRQQGLRAQIAELKRDLEAAVKDAK